MERRRVPLLGALLFYFLFWSPAATFALPEADRLWLVATEAFNDQLYRLAQQTLDRFVLRYPDDPRVPAAVLLLGKTRLALGVLEHAVDAFRQARRFPTPPGEPGEVQFLEGKTLLQLKRYAEAQVAFEAVLRAPASPLTPDALYGLARATLQQNQLEPAVEALRRLLSSWPIHPTAPAATYQLARALADLNRPGEVRTVLAGYETAYPDSPWLADALYLRGWSQLTTGQLEAATNTLQSFLARAPAHALAPQAQFYLAEALLRLGKKADGLQHLKTLLTAPAPTAELLYATGLLAQRFDAPAEAEQAWRRLQVHFPTHPLAYRASLELARAAFTQQRYAEALAAVTAAAASADPQVQLEARLLSGESLLQLKRYAEARAAFETVLRAPASPLTPDALYGLARATLQQNQLEPAVEALRRLLSSWPIHPTAPAATYQLARALADLNRPGEVRTVLAGYETAYPDSPWLADALYLRGWSQLTTGQLEAATNTLQSFLARAPAHALAPQAQFYLAEALLRLGKKADGLQHLKTLLTAPAPTAELLYATGLLAQRFDAPAEAEQAWRRLQVHFPTHPLAYRASLELARAAFTQQRYAEALAAVTAAAASADPQVQLEARLLSGESLLQLKRAGAALREFKTALDQTPSVHPLRLRAMAGLGLAHERLQQWAAATRLYQEVANSSDDELKEWALQRLKAIRSQRQPGSEKIPKQGREGSPSAKPTPER
jgi:TolA-binding protein